MASIDLAIIFLAIALGALIKGLTGAGTPLVAIPVMAIFLDVERAVMAMTIPSLASNGWLMWSLRSHLRENRQLPVLLLTGIPGVVLGTLALKAADARTLSAVVAVLVLGYVLLRLGKPDFALRASLERRLSPAVGLGGGVLQGATGMSGPLLITYLHSCRLEPPVYVVSLVTMFQVFAVVQIASLVGTGLYTAANLIDGLFALVPMAIALPIGIRLADRISRRSFDLWVLGLLLGTATKLGYDAVVG